MSEHPNQAHPEFAAAQEHARKNGATSPAYHTDDAWGGYWQCATEHGPYNFRISPKKVAT
jgi:hypothetical protein